MARLSLVAAVSLSISGCSLLQGVYPTGDDVIAQATPGSEIAFDVVKVSDAVVTTLDAHQPPPFHQRFKPYEPAPELKIAVGDILSTVVWESSPEGLFGYSLRQLGGTGAGQIAEASSVALRNPTVTSVTAPSLETAPQSNTAISALALEQAAGTQAATNRGRGLDLSDIAAARAANQFAAERNANAIASSIAAGSLFGGARAAVPDQSAEYHAGTTIPDQVVGPDGTITIPYGGAISVVGRTPAEVQRSVEERLTGKALQPQALVVIKQSLANSVSISGSAVPGKRVTLGPGGSRLLDVIAAAGQARAPVRDTILRLSRDGVTGSIPLKTLVSDPGENIYARPGDVLTLDQRPQTFSVFGTTGKNAAITFNADKLTLSEALAQSGGLNDDQADPSAIFLFRYEPTAIVEALGQPVATHAPSGVSPIAYRLDLRDPKSFLLAKQFPVHDKDVIFVAEATIRPVYRFFQALSNITGPIQTGLLVCQNNNC